MRRKRYKTRELITSENKKSLVNSGVGCQHQSEALLARTEPHTALCVHVCQGKPPYKPSAFKYMSTCEYLTFSEDRLYKCYRQFYLLNIATDNIYFCEFKELGHSIRNLQQNPVSSLPEIETLKGVKKWIYQTHPRGHPQSRTSRRRVVPSGFQICPQGSCFRKKKRTFICSCRLQKSPKS